MKKGQKDGLVCFYILCDTKRVVTSTSLYHESSFASTGQWTYYSFWKTNTVHHHYIFSYINTKCHMSQMRAIVINAPTAQN